MFRHCCATFSVAQSISPATLSRKSLANLQHIMAFKQRGEEKAGSCFASKRLAVKPKRPSLLIPLWGAKTKATIKAVYLSLLIPGSHNVSGCFCVTRLPYGARSSEHRESSAGTQTPQTTKSTGASAQRKYFLPLKSFSGLLLKLGLSVAML